MGASHVVSPISVQVMQQVIVTLVTLQKDRQVMKSELQPILVGLYNMLQLFLVLPMAPLAGWPAVSRQEAREPSKFIPSFACSSGMLGRRARERKWGFDH